MKGGTTTAHGRSRKLLASSFTLASAFALTYPAAQPVSAIANTYEWVKHSEQDLQGGTYTSVASSADGSRLIVGTRDGGEGFNAASPLYISADYGANWENVTETADNRIRNNWTSVDITDDGQTMVAVSDGGVNLDNLNSTPGKIFISHNGGASWTNVTPDETAEWQAVAIAGDGSKIVAVTNDDLSDVYISTNGGTSWTTSSVDAVRYWESASISDNGGKILVGGENPDNNNTSHIYLSDDGGDNWTDVTPDGGDLVFISRTAMSSDGSKIAVSSEAWNGSDTYDAVYTSTDDGTNWADVKPDNPDANVWRAIAYSGNGKILSVLDSVGNMYITSDDGANWAPEDPGQADNDDNNWRSIDFNNSGSRIIVASNAFAYSGHNAALDPVTVDLSNAENSKAVELTTPAGTTITCHTAVKESGLSAQDGAYSYPLGLVDFCFSGADASNGVTLVFATDLKPNQVTVRKYNPTTKTYTTITGATITETTLGGQHALQVSYTIADNGPLDTDPDTGEIADPVGLAVTASAPNTGLAHQSSAPATLALLAGTSLATGLLAATIRRQIKKN